MVPITFILISIPELSHLATSNCVHSGCVSKKTVMLTTDQSLSKQVNFSLRLHGDSVKTKIAIILCILLRTLRDC